jgi:hypothetical protein
LEHDLFPKTGTHFSGSCSKILALSSATSLLTTGNAESVFSVKGPGAVQSRPATLYGAANLGNRDLGMGSSLKPIIGTFRTTQYPAQAHYQHPRRKHQTQDSICLQPAMKLWLAILRCALMGPHCALPRNARDLKKGLQELRLFLGTLEDIRHITYSLHRLGAPTRLMWRKQTAIYSPLSRMISGIARVP